jgi:hypothetical protein
MQRDSHGLNLSAVFVDYDNIYLSLKRKNEEAAKRFAKDASVWIRAIENGQLITPTNGSLSTAKRRIVMNRCYGNPVPRRNTHDNSTDMNSFPFVRHHFLRAGFEIVDCPPLTAQLKNSSDIRMVMDMRDYLTHETYFEEFVILSGDADFTPVLHRLRQHARRTVIFANDHTATPYTAICDGEVRESDLIALLLGADAPQLSATTSAPQVASEPMMAEAAPARAQPPRPIELRREIVAEVVASVRTSPAPIPLETLADRAVRVLGHDRTAGTNWAGAGTFRELLKQELPADVRVSEQPPFVAYDVRRQLAAKEAASMAAEPRPIAPQVAAAPIVEAPQPAPSAAYAPTASTVDHAAPPRVHDVDVAPAPQRPAPTPVQQSIMRIYAASQAPQIAPAEYRVLFEGMAAEITEHQLNGDVTLQNIVTRARDRGVDVHAEDVRFVLDVVGETDPWFEQGVSANLFAGRFRNFIVGRCREMGMKLSASELDMIDSWFAPLPVARNAERLAERVAAALPMQSPVAVSPPPPVAPVSRPAAMAPVAQVEPQGRAVADIAPAAAHFEPPQTQVRSHAPRAPADTTQRASRWWALDNGQASDGDTRGAGTMTSAAAEEEEFPRIVRSRSRS